MSDKTTASEARIIRDEWWDEVQLALTTLYALAPLEHPNSPCLSVAVGTGLDPETGGTIPACRGKVAGPDNEVKGFSANPTKEGLAVMQEVRGVLEQRLAAATGEVH